jgi:imidazolonepropionase
LIRADLVIVDAAQLITMKGPAPRTGARLKDPEVIEGGCLAARGGRIVFVGARDQFEAEVAEDGSTQVIDASDRVVMPGFVDAHTHIPFAGTREHEFARRMAGATYQEIARDGGGIMSTVRATRAAGTEELTDAILQRLDRMLQEGITTCEAKSGYGLTLADEVRLLRTLREAAAHHPIDVAPTFLGAHTVPAERSADRESYIRLVIEEMIPAVASERLAEFCDVFCEEGAFTVEESRRVLSAGTAAGLRPRIHADQLTSFGGAELAAELHAASADHLDHASEEGLRMMARAGVPAVLLPGASFCMMHRSYAPARRMIDLGVAPALATDLNPGTCHIESMQFMVALACLNMDMTVEEAIAAATINAAVTIGRDRTVGSLEVGKAADLLVLEIPNYLHLAYRPAANHVGTVIKNGEVVVRERRLDYEEDSAGSEAGS